ncbi:unnamed protein product [Spirodela intermedia]|uniref:Arf-GAP domain-containing protein n=1 Tax=Spirodela intermedia TaxID=51605 RepID=A0A7I8IVX7_SPIIN|nr:unnamed protein product [Spirodela intermedia]CAA6661930.1 unnamed protein product [Spirodela intermedia]
MSSRKEEERNEKIIRGLMKLPPNRRCINCNSLGPQYVCTNFWTFVCISCSGIHREFTHRVKSVSMAKFTTKEVEALQKGGNQRAREIFLSDWDFQRTRLPDSSQKSFEEDHRRASSYHSYSQSPPYDHQYEDRRYGKQSGMLTRKPGSDRGTFEGKISSLIYSPGRLGEQMYEDRFANEISGPRISDFSVSSTGDTLKFDGQPPNFQGDSTCVTNTQQVREILIEDGRCQVSTQYSEANPRRNVESALHSQRSASSGSFGSFDSNSVSLKSVNSGGSREVVIEAEQPQSSSPIQPSFAQQGTIPSASSSDFFAENQYSSTSLFESPLSQSSLHGNLGNPNMSGPSFVQQATSSSVLPLDLFAEITHPSSSTTLDKSQPVPFSEKEGWATFDLPPSGSASETKPTTFSTIVPVDGIGTAVFDALPPTGNNTQRSLEQSSFSHEASPSFTGQWNSGTSLVKLASEATTSQTWNAFDDSLRGFPLPSFGSSVPKNEVQVPAHIPPTIVDQKVLLMSSDFDRDGLQISGIGGRAVGSSFNPVIPPMGANSRESKSTNPFDIPYESDLEPFLDMSPLQATLPSVQFPPPFLNNLGQQWFPQNPMPPYVASVASVPLAGSLPYMAGQPPSSQLPDIPSQGPVASLGGNPFA